jgi:hypothetical protein
MTVKLCGAWFLFSPGPCGFMGVVLYFVSLQLICTTHKKKKYKKKQKKLSTCVLSPSPAAK